MKINHVEELTGITKKNIRFYEDQGLLKPSRNPGNGYRDYSLADVALLRKVRLFRKLAVPVEDIRQMIAAGLSLQDCMDKRLAELKREEINNTHMQLICREMLERQVVFEEIDVEYYLEEMEQMEKGGTQFMDVEKVDKRKKKIAPLVVTIATVVVMLSFVTGIWQLNQTDPAPIGIVVILLALPLFVIIGVIYACRERMKEIEGGEWNEAGKY